MEQNSRKKAEQYTVEKMVERTEKLYEELLIDSCSIHRAA
jgi:hypothetical protein